MDNFGDTVLINGNVDKDILRLGDIHCQCKDNETGEPKNIFLEEILEYIFRFLTDQELSLVSLVCRFWRRCSNLDKLWLPRCKLRGWLKYGTTSDLTVEPPFMPKATNVSGTSPEFLTHVPADSALEPICKWKSVYLRSYHLNVNWATGRYNVGPLLRKHKKKVTALDCDGKHIVSGSSNGSFYIWDLARCESIFQNDYHLNSITDVRIVNGTIVTVSTDKHIRVFDCKTGELTYSFGGYGTGIEFMSFNGVIIISVHTDRMLRVWNLHQKKLKHTLRGHTDDIECISTFGRYALTGAWDNTLRLWDVEGGAEVITYTGHTEVVMSCQFDGSHVVSGSGDSTVRVWSTLTGECNHVLAGHEGEVYCVKFLGAYIASGSSDSTIRIWKLDGVCLHVLHAHLGCVRCLVMDQERLVSGGDQKKIIVWDYKAGKLLNIVHRNPSKIHKMWVNETKIVTASPEEPGTITVISYW